MATDTVLYSRKPSEYLIYGKSYYGYNHKDIKDYTVNNDAWIDFGKVTGPEPTSTQQQIFDITKPIMTNYSFEKVDTIITKSTGYRDGGGNIKNYSLYPYTNESQFPEIRAAAAAQLKQNRDERQFSFGGGRIKRIGSKLDVFKDLALKTSGGLTKNDLKKNKRGKVVSRKQSSAAKARFNSNPKIKPGNNERMAVLRTMRKKLS